MPTQFPVNPINNLSNSANPLNQLEQSGYNVSSFTYPIDLTADPGENHMVVFYINESANTQFQTTNSQGQVQVNNNGSFNLVSPNQNPTGASSPGVSGATPSVNSSSNVSTFNNRPINRVATTIAMYIPPVVQTTYNTQWDAVEGGMPAGVAKSMLGQNPSLRRMMGEIAIDALGGLLESGKDAASTHLGIGAELEAGVSFATRAVRNPNLEMLFRGIGFREYQFDFVFTPRSEQEGINVANIIKAFKFYSAPELRHGNNTPKYYIWPAEFDIEFWSNGTQNNFINKISTCACTSVQVNYTGAGGWTAFRGNTTPGFINGMSVETHLTLQFKEIEIMTKERILQGY